MDVSLSNTCATAFLWSPAEGIDSMETNRREPTITPAQSGEFVYTVRMNDNFSSCIAKDSIIIRVTDTNNLPCDELFLPKAFTPNGDGLNDLFGISNPFVLQNLISFEIFDRWGNRVFITDNADEKWDGLYNGKEVNPGSMLYRILFECNGEEKAVVGNFAIIK